MRFRVEVTTTHYDVAMVEAPDPVEARRRVGLPNDYEIEWEPGRYSETETHRVQEVADV